MPTNIERFLLAARDGNIVVIQNLLAQHLVDINSTLPQDFEDIAQGTTAFMLAAGNGHRTTAKYLAVTASADVSLVNSQGLNAFDFLMNSTISEGADEIAILIFEQLFKLIKFPNQNATLSVQKEPSEWQLEQARIYGRPIVQEAISYSYLTQELMLAEKKHQAEILRIDDVQETPYLVYAAEKGMFRTFLKLIQIGVPYKKSFAPLLPGQYEEDICSPLDAAIYNDSINIAKFLMTGNFSDNLPIRDQRLVADKILVLLDEPNIENELSVKVKNIIPTRVVMVHESDLRAATAYSGYEMIMAVYDAVQNTTGKELDLDWVILVSDVLKRKYPENDVNGVQRNLSSGVDYSTAKELVLMLVDKQIPVDQSIIFSAVESGAPTWFIEFLIKTFKFDVPYIKLANGTTLLQHAINFSSVGSLPALCARGAQLTELTSENLAATIYPFRAAYNNIHTVFTASILAFAVMSKHNQLLNNLLSLDESIFPKATRQAQLDQILIEGKELTVGNFLREYATEYNNVIKTLTDNGLNVIAKPNPIQTPTPSSNGRQSRNSTSPFTMPSIMGCFGGATSTPSSTTSSRSSPTPQVSTEETDPPNLITTSGIFGRFRQDTATPPTPSSPPNFGSSFSLFKRKSKNTLGTEDSVRGTVRVLTTVTLSSPVTNSNTSAPVLSPKPNTLTLG